MKKHIEQLVITGGEDPDFARFDREPNFVPTIPERFNKYAVPPSASNGTTFYRNARCMDEFRDAIATDLASSWCQINIFVMIHCTWMLDGFSLYLFNAR